MDEKINLLKRFSDTEKRFNIKYPQEVTIKKNTIVNYSNESNKEYQRWYKYKEGYSIDVVNKVLSKYNLNKNDVILDPFIGSGTTALAASYLGLQTIGFEINPFSYFLTSTKLDNYTDSDILNFKENFETIINTDLTLVKESELPSLKFKDKIFKQNIKEYYMKVLTLINNLTESKYKNLLKLLWLSCLEDVSNYKKDGNGLKTKSQKKIDTITINYCKDKLTEKFIMIYNDLTNNKISRTTTIHKESCLNMSDYIKDSSISGIIFSPPYANCFDYNEIYKLELWFSGIVKNYDEFKSLKKMSIRSNLSSLNKEDNDITTQIPLINETISLLKSKKLWNNKIPKMISAYFNDMFKVLESSYNSLKEDGFCTIVVANSCYGGVAIPTDIFLTLCAEKIGFNVECIDVERYLNTSSQQNNIITTEKNLLRESIIYLRK